MRKEFEHLALLAGGSHYPQVGGDNLELFGKLLVKDCVEVVGTRTIADEHTEWENGYNSALRKVTFDLKQKYGIE
jgi:hypothetical protein